LDSSIVRLVVAAVLLSACIELPDFPDGNLVLEPRPLAIVADPPEARPGQSVQLSLMLSHPLPGAEVQWRVCGEYFSFSGGNQYGDGESGEGCGANDPAIASGEQVELPGVLSAALFANLDLAREVLGASLPEGTIDLVRTRVGLPVLVEARLQHERRTLRATKRLLVSDRQDGNANPPPPRFELDDQLVIGVEDLDQPFTCAGVSGRVPVVEPGSEVKLAPVVDGDEEPWLERYQIIDARGDLQNRTETAFYSWYVSGGDVGPGTTKGPDRDATWQTPKEPGCQRVWVIIRDGHGGTSACGVDVAVATGDAAESECHRE
ncbi:MAG TPA: hypothetical protein VK509_07290, partial [Polyangiales bacterium]|nr:hypothetical protein [Polyangiales bacterium]